MGAERRPQPLLERRGCRRPALVGGQRLDLGQPLGIGHPGFELATRCEENVAPASEQVRPARRERHHRIESRQCRVGAAELDLEVDREVLERG